MKSILLTVQGLRIKELNGRKNQLLDSFSAKEADLYDVLHQFLLLRKNDAFKAEDSQQAFQVGQIETSKKRQIEGIIHAGNWGSEHPIRNLDKWSKIAYLKKLRDVETTPFYFLFDIPEGRDLGYLLLQSSGIESIQTLLGRMLHEHFIKEFPDERLRFHRIVHPDVAKALARSPISEVRLLRHSIPRDFAKTIKPGATDQISGTMSLSLKLEEDSTLGSAAIRKFFEGRRGTESVFELEDVEFPYDSVKMKVKLNGKEHTIDLENPDRIRGSFDVTEEITRGPDGHPTFASISEIAKGKLDDLKTVLSGGRRVPG
jgi:hypothetical protein